MLSKIRNLNEGGKTVAIYRAEKKVDGSCVKKQRPGTRRAPGNVPYVVDNLWEWVRPNGFPNRRHSVFSSPSPGGAEKSALIADQTYTVTFPGEALIAQIVGYEDARWHPDCKSLPKKLLSVLSESGWIEKGIEEKSAVAPLWAPCLLREEVESLFSLEPLKSVREEIRSSISFWKDVKLLESVEMVGNVGEIFFEAEEWVLHPFLPEN